ncbi:MAG TPA: phosphoribosylanthranilate isomerase [Phycisphaerales bacterium]|nr:phosphoribosylanthranilate isomerase [Phycisphaerales bacterium]
MGRTRIKICGVRDVETALCAAECGADAIGFVFVKASPRYVTPDGAEEIAAYLPPFVQTVGLFVNPSAQQVEEAAEVCLFDFLQLHGNEPEPFVRECGGRVIKAVRFDAGSIEGDLLKWNRLAEIDALLVDGGSGGEGRPFDWAALARVQDLCEHPLILAGGLTPENVGEAIRAVRPWAVDVSSGVERSPGEKDPDLIAAFCEAVHRADAAG